MTRQYIAQSDSGMLEFDIRRKVVQYLEGIPDNYFPFIPTVLRDGHAEPFSPIPDWSYDGAVPSLFGSSKFWTGFQRHPSNRAGFGLGEEPEVFNVDLYLSGMADCSMSVAITRYVVIPHWFLFALTAILPAIWAARRTAAWRHRRRGPGFCVACGYNLTGNTSGKCPECGTAIPNDRAVIRPSPARL